MFKNAKALDKQRHRDLTYTPVQGYDFASQLPVSILDHTELVHASKHFPIVFPDPAENQQSGLPQAVLSIERDKNAFVADDGSWLAGYTPKHIRRYPFILGRLADDNRFAVMIDEDAAQFAGEKGNAMFTDTGEPTQIVQKATEFLEKYKKDIDITLQLVNEIEKQDLFKPMTFKITKGKAAKQITGFRVVDVKKMIEMDDLILAQWVKKGLMGIIYAHLFSLQNFTALAKLQGIEASVPDAE